MNLFHTKIYSTQDTCNQSPGFIIPRGYCFEFHLSLKMLFTEASQYSLHLVSESDASFASLILTLHSGNVASLSPSICYTKSWQLQTIWRVPSRCRKGHHFKVQAQWDNFTGQMATTDGFNVCSHSVAGFSSGLLQVFSGEGACSGTILFFLVTKARPGGKESSPQCSTVQEKMEGGPRRAETVPMQERRREEGCRHGGSEMGMFCQGQVCMRKE